MPDNKNRPIRCSIIYDLVTKKHDQKIAWIIGKICTIILIIITQW